MTLILLFCVVPATASGDDWFVDVSREVGLSFHHYDGRSGAKHYIETTASGGGWLDFDGDGKLDIYLINGATTPGSSLTKTARNALFHQRNGVFTDVAEAAGVDDDAYGMGLCTGDFDADGRLDLFVTNYGPDRLYRNLGPDSRGQVRFVDLARELSVSENDWSVACAFGDLDGDGDLDLYVSHYLDFSYDRSPACSDPLTGNKIYCRPVDFRGVTDSLFINPGRANSLFKEEGQQRGLASGTSEKSLGMLFNDLDGDGDLDIYVANDGALNRLYINNSKGIFEDSALMSGAGLSALGIAEAGMGVDAGDVDGDGKVDLVLSHFAMETNTLYRNLGGLQFDDITVTAGLGRVSYKNVGWGIKFLDFDNDGDLDLAVANGHMQEGVEALEPGLRYRQPNQLLENVSETSGRTRFRDVSDAAGKAFAQAEVSRGLAIGDWNNDGRLDILCTNTNANAQLLENRVESSNHWLGLDLRGPPSNPFAIGARAVVTTIEGEPKRIIRDVQSGGSFQAQSDLRLHFGLGTHQGPVEIEILWPNGHSQTEKINQLDRYSTIRYRAP